jgi:hypothetical protein
MKKKEEGGKMIARTKKAKIFVTAVFLVLALTLVLPTVASAGILRHSGPMWRGSGLAAIYVYGKAYNSADAIYVWMEVHSYIYEQYSSGGPWYLVGDEVNGGDYISYKSCTAKHSGAMHSTFKLKSFHEWDLDGYTYCAEWQEDAANPYIHL